MSDLHPAIPSAPSVINQTDGCGVVRGKGSPDLETLRRRMKEMYRSMHTADIAALLHVTEAEVFNAVFGTRAQTLGRKP